MVRFISGMEEPLVRKFILSVEPIHHGKEGPAHFMVAEAPHMVANQEAEEAEAGITCTGWPHLPKVSPCSPKHLLRTKRHVPLGTVHTETLTLAVGWAFHHLVAIPGERRDWILDLLSTQVPALTQNCLS